MQNWLNFSFFFVNLTFFFQQFLITIQQNYNSAKLRYEDIKSSCILTANEKTPANHIY